MPERWQSTMGDGKRPRLGPNCRPAGLRPAGTRVAGKEPARSSRLPRRKSANPRHPADILAGLPQHVMDELVEDMAEAVVAMLLSQTAIESDEDEHASGDLRKI